MKYQDLTLYSVNPAFRGRSRVYVQLWRLVQVTLFRCSPQPFYGFRASLLRLFGAKVGTATTIRQSCRVTYPWKVQIGDRVQIGDYAELYSLGEIVIGNDSIVSQRSYVCAGDHDHTDVRFTIRSRPITIGDQVWVGTDTFVGPGVRIGAGSVIGARSSVFSDMPPGMICLGSPCKPVKPRVMNSEKDGVR